MPKTLTFLHTASVHVATFDHLISEIDPQIPVRHIVDESLLAEARAAGAITPALARRVAGVVNAALDEDAGVVVCTCSTIGGCAEAAPHDRQGSVLRIDRAMAEQAVARGRRIVVIAALRSTLEPTRRLIEAVAQAAGAAPTIEERLSEDAWAAFEAGDQPRYLAAIAATLRAAAPFGDVLVLAQASMAPAAALCPELTVPILSSPRLGAEAAVQAYRLADGT